MRRSVWQNMAAGRATVRNRALRRARWAKDDLGRLQQCLEAGADIHWLYLKYDLLGYYTQNPQQLRDRIIGRVGLEVWTARRAHQTWRRYRNLHQHYRNLHQHFSKEYQ